MTPPPGERCPEFDEYVEQLKALERMGSLPEPVSWYLSNIDNPNETGPIFDRLRRLRAGPTHAEAKGGEGLPTEHELCEWRALRSLAAPGPQTLVTVYRVAFPALLDAYATLEATITRLEGELVAQVDNVRRELCKMTAERDEARAEVTVWERAAESVEQAAVDRVDAAERKLSEATAESARLRELLAHALTYVLDSPRTGAPAVRDRIRAALALPAAVEGKEGT